MFARQKSRFTRWFSVLLVLMFGGWGMVPATLVFGTDCFCPNAIDSSAVKSTASPEKGSLTKGCGKCSAVESIELGGCCGQRPIKEPPASSCQAKNPSACHCGLYCACSDHEPDSRPTAPPSQRHEDLQSVVISTAVIPVLVMPDRGLRNLLRRMTVAEHLAFSSHQKCVILSRFTC